MKDKRQKAIRDISMLALLVVLILGKLGKVKVTVMLAIVCSILLVLFGVYCMYRRLKLVGVTFLSLAFAAILVVLSYYCNSDILSVPIPGVLTLTFILGYKATEISHSKEEVKKLKKSFVISAIISSIIQIVMLIAYLTK